LLQKAARILVSFITAVKHYFQCTFMQTFTPDVQIACVQLAPIGEGAHHNK